MRYNQGERTHQILENLRRFCFDVVVVVGVVVVVFCCFCGCCGFGGCCFVNCVYGFGICCSEF